MNRAWRSRAIQKIGFFAILAVLGIMVVRWILFVRAQAMPTTLDMTYSNQQNNRLCFFVVPAFYVLPYISTSFATSAKWLISIEKGRN